MMVNLKHFPMVVSWLSFTAAGKMHLFGGLRVGLKDAVGRKPHFLSPIPFHRASLNNAGFPQSKKLRANGRDCKSFYDDLFSLKVSWHIVCTAQCSSKSCHKGVPTENKAISCEVHAKKCVN